MGWSTGFITTPLTTGSLPSQHLDPALPKLFWFTPTLPTCPTVAKQFWDTKLTSPDVYPKVFDLPSFAISFATAPAALANCPPLPRVISMLCMAVPKGISVEGMAFPIDIGTFVPETIVSLIIAPLGCKIYLFSPSS
ncbi:unnamed protein product [Triticum turgidum subsp. durum]|uniref:Uncharacterized protein ycf72 n=1 Tax=Triticum turgidum subsp. durum TaxID=4567 RepID=A0A9R0WCM0_TRITD|nr:unnamed protein product [Triticum turgidum subsp. durum]